MGNSKVIVAEVEQISRTSIKAKVLKKMDSAGKKRVYKIVLTGGKFIEIYFKRIMMSRANAVAFILINVHIQIWEPWCSCKDTVESDLEVNHGIPCVCHVFPNILATVLRIFDNIWYLAFFFNWNFFKNYTEFILKFLTY